jgi:uncharacterized protein
MVYFAKNIKESRAYFLDDATLRRYAQDILLHPEFTGMKHYTSHKHESRQKHLLNVAYYAVKIARFLRADLQTVTRASLLHDFYPYQRFRKNIKYREHLRQHPKDALAHAEALFPLSYTEKEIILKHMWPMVKGKPKHREAAAVILSDVYASIFENFYHRAWQKSKRGAVRVKEKSKSGAKKVASATKTAGKKVKTAGQKVKKTYRKRKNDKI